jgi:hypothetical protein
MKKIILILVLALSPIAKAQIPTVTLDVINKFEGQVVTICEKVTGTHETKGNTVFINFGKPFPNNEFSIVIFPSAVEKFSYNPKEFLKGKTICVRGKVVLYKDKLEMIVNKEEDIVVQ